MQITTLVFCSHVPHLSLLSLLCLDEANTFFKEEEIVNSWHHYHVITKQWNFPVALFLVHDIRSLVQLCAGRGQVVCQVFRLQLQLQLASVLVAFTLEMLLLLPGQVQLHSN
jgi:hypothetical protein